MRKRSFKAPVVATTSTSSTATTTRNDGIDNRGGGDGENNNNKKNMPEKRKNSSKKTTSTGITALQEINTASLSADVENSELETKKSSKTQQEKERSRKSMTNDDYEELFDAVLRKSLIEECCRKTTRTESNTHSEQSPKEYASLQPVCADEDPKAVDDSACDADGPPEKERAATDNVTPSKAREVPVWRAVSPIADMKESNRRRLSAEKAKSAGTKAGFSLGNFRKDKENCKPRKSSKGDGSHGKPPSSKKRKVQEERQEEVESWSLTQECTKGVWVQCANDNCCKWRHLDYIHDPSKFISVRWTCADNEDKYHNSCDAPVEHWDENADWTYNRYTEGSLVWARVDGYPWWPAMIEIDPDMEAFVFCYDHSSYTPVEYHVTFFDSEKATRAWLLPKHIKPFIADKVDQEISNKIGNNRLMHAVKQAQQCSQLPLAQRLRTYSFTIRYDGKIVGNKTKGATNYLQSSSSHQAHKSKSSRQAETIKPGRKPRREKKKATPTSAVGSSETPRMKTTKTPAATKTAGGDTGDALTEASCLALLPAPSDKPASAVTSRQHSPTDGSRQRSPADGSRQHTPTGDSLQPSSTLPANDNEHSEKLDFEKELDEIEGILSQSLMSQSQKSSSLSPAPGRNFPLTSSGSRDNSQSNRGTNGQSGDSQSQTGESQPGHSQSQSQRTSTPSPHRAKAGGPQKKMKKGFKCPAISPSSSQSGSKSDKKATVSKPAPVNLANNSLFTQELSTGAATAQQSTLFDQGLRLTGNSVFTQELSGKDLFIRGSTNPFTKAADLACAQEDAPGDDGQLKLSGNSLYTQELSAKDPFTNASNVTVTEKKGFDNSIFTQELSNKQTFASDLEPEAIASHKMRDVNPLDIFPEC